MLFLLWLHLFILSGVISPLISSSILGTYSPGESIFLCPALAFSHCSWGSQGKNMEVWLAIPFSSGPHSVRPIHHDLSVLAGSTWHGSQVHLGLRSELISLIFSVCLKLCHFVIPTKIIFDFINFLLLFLSLYNVSCF